MRETVLLINFKDEERLRAIEKILIQRDILVKKIKKEDYAQCIGALAGIEELYKEGAVYEGDEIESEMMIFAFLQRGTLDYILQSMRENGIAKVNCKAMLTNTNRNWLVPALFKELKAEHEYMIRRRKEIKNN